MNQSLLPFTLSLALVLGSLSTADSRAEEADPERMANAVVLDELGVANLRIETAEVSEDDFAETIYALGHIEVLPGKRAIVSSRIPGRAYSVLATPDQQVDQGEELMWVESRQPGDPPPTVMLEAPIDGIISKVDIAVGQPIEPTQELMEIIDLDVVEAAAQVPQHLAGRLAREQVAKIRVLGYQDKVFEAKLAHLGSYASGETGTVEAAFHVENADHLLRPGMRAEFSIVTGKREGVMSVPRSALQGDPTNRFVYVKDFDLENVFIKTPVVVGKMNEEMVEIVSGLFPADEVVTKGGYSLSFAGGGTMSLKEALDAAHGHEHNDDGSEKTAEQKAAEAGPGHDHEGGAGKAGPLTFISLAGNAILLVLLVLAGIKRGKTEEE